MSKWLQENELALNLKKGKTEVMLLGTKKRLNQQEREIEINYQSQHINNTNNYKYLGVQLDPSLNMQEHFNSICRKASSCIPLLEKNKTFHYRPSHSEDIPSTYCTNNYILFPYKLLSSTIPKIINTCTRVLCLQTDQQRHTISQQNLPKKNMYNCV